MRQCGERQQRQRRDDAERRPRPQRDVERVSHQPRAGNRPCGPEIEHHRHQHVDQHRSDRRAGLGRDRGGKHLAEQQRQEGAADGVDHAHQQRADQRAADRADAADAR